MSAWRGKTWNIIEKTFLSVKFLGGGEALTDMSAKNAIFFGTAPLKKIIHLLHDDTRKQLHASNISTDALSYKKLRL